MTAPNFEKIYQQFIPKCMFVNHLQLHANTQACVIFLDFGCLYLYLVEIKSQLITIHTIYVVSRTKSFMHEKIMGMKFSGMKMKFSGMK